MRNSVVEYKTIALSYNKTVFEAPNQAKPVLANYKYHRKYLNETKLCKFTCRRAHLLLGFIWGAFENYAQKSLFRVVTKTTTNKSCMFSLSSEGKAFHTHLAHVNFNLFL